MNYPTLDEVAAADHRQICTWWRMLPSPGLSALGTTEFETAMESQSRVMDAIAERFKQGGGFSASLSKEIGWGK